MSKAAEKSAESNTIAQALCAAEAAQSKKGFAVALIDVQGRCSYADAIMIVSAKNDRQTMAIAKSIEDAIRETFNIKASHREGRGAWNLIDFGDLLVHVFQEDSRAYYDIDQLWKDAPRIPVPALDHPVIDQSPTSLAQRKSNS